MDYLSAEAAQGLHFEMTHEAYYGRMPEEFGTTITSARSSTSRRCTAPQARCWTPSFNDDLRPRVRLQPGAATTRPCGTTSVPETASAARNALFASAGRAVRGGLSASASASGAESHGIAGDRTSGQRGARESGRHVGRPDEVLQIPGRSGHRQDRRRPAGRAVLQGSQLGGRTTGTARWSMSETYGAMGNIPWDTLYRVAHGPVRQGDQHADPARGLVRRPGRDVRARAVAPQPAVPPGTVRVQHVSSARLNVLLRNDDAASAPDVADAVSDRDDAGRRTTVRRPAGTAYAGGVRRSRTWITCRSASG